MRILLLLFKMIIDSHGSVGSDSASAVKILVCDNVMCDARGSVMLIKMREFSNQ